MKYSADKVAEIRRAYAEVQSNLQDLVVDLPANLAPILKVEKAQEYLTQGVCRRLGIIQRSMENIFSLHPVDRTELLSHDEQSDLAINLHAFLIHTHGIPDNLAWVYALENKLGLKADHVGLFKQETKKALPDEVRNYVNSEAIAGWHKTYAKNFRDALAHRVPPYIPPFVISSRNADRYNELQLQINTATARREFGQVLALCEAQESIGQIAIAYAHSLNECSPMILHPQIIVDARTVIEIIHTIRPYLLPKEQSNEIKSYRLGPLPWSNELIRREYFKSFTSVREAINEHPGYAVHKWISSLEKSFGIFKTSVQDLFNSIEKFKQEADAGELFGRPERKKFDELVLKVEKELYTAASAAKALIDLSQIIREECNIAAQYGNKLAETFQANEHIFIVNLRDYTNHGKVAPVNWNRKWARDQPVRTEFRLDAAKLLESKRWTSPAREYIKAHPNGIDIRSLFEDYAMRTAKFQEWFRDTIAKNREEDLREYRRYITFVNAIDSHCFWREMMRQVLSRGLDPYLYLDDHLTPAELQEVLQLPKHSAKQVDRIIEILDEYAACDNDLRNSAYEAFGVSKPE
ncbi:MAG: hypothetical protein HRU82_07070 [Nitrospira sp.]|nr:MAG: hypothetical protein HRU82_07070 [Nitrospira sp.]